MYLRRLWFTGGRDSTSCFSCFTPCRGRITRSERLSAGRRRRECENQFNGSRALPYRVTVLAQKLGTGQELLIFVEGDDGLRQLSEIEFKKRSDCVHIGVAAENTQMGDPCLILKRKLVSQLLIENKR